MPDRLGKIVDLALTTSSLANLRLKEGVFNILLYLVINSAVEKG